MSEAADFDQRISEADEVLADDRGSEDPVARRRVADALMDKAQALVGLGRVAEAIAVWDEVLQFGAEEQDPDCVVLDAMYAQAYHLKRLGQLDQAIERCDLLVSRYRSQADDRTRRTVGYCLELKRNALNEARRGEQVIAANDEVIAWLDGDAPDHLSRVGYALSNKSWWLLRLGRVDAAIAVSEQLIGNLETSGDPVEDMATYKRLLSTGEAFLNVARIGDDRHDRARRAAGVALMTTAKAAQRTLDLALTGAKWAVARGWHRSPTQSERSILRGGPPDWIWPSLAEQRKRYAQAERILTLLATRLQSSTAPEAQVLYAGARFQLATAAAMQGHPVICARVMNEVFELGQPAIDAFHETARGWREGSGRGARQAEAGAVMGRALAIEAAADNPVDAAAGYDELIAEFEHDRAFMVRRLVQAAKSLRKSIGKQNRRTA